MKRANQSRRAIACIYLVFAMLSAAAAAKSPQPAATGTLEGKLTDWHSAALADAAILVRNISTGDTARGVTGKNGSYRFENLGPGEYRLEAVVPQLGRGAVDGILVSAGHATRVQAALMMDLPGLPDSIEVEVHTLDPVTPAVTTMIPTEELNALPVSTRNWQEFAAITPAGNRAPQTESSGGDSLGQSSARELGGAYQAVGSIDGVESPPTFKSPSGRQLRLGESLGESAVQTMEARSGNAPADQGRSSNGTAGGAINLNTARGVHGLHGQAFYLDRQNLWGAQNPFTQWIKETSPASGIAIAQFAPQPYTPANARQTLGLGVGRQMARDKIFWFAALDGLLSNDPAVATVRHPSDFFAQPNVDELTVLAARLDLPGPALLEIAAANYSGWLEQLNGLLGPVPRNSAQWQGFARIDWQATERQHLSLEGNAAIVHAPSGAISSASETYGSHSFGNSQASEAWSLAKLDSFLTANLLNSAAAEYRRSLQSETRQAPSNFEAPLLANSNGQLPEIVADSKYGFLLGKPARLGNGNNPDERSFVGQDTLSWVHGASLVKIGANFDHVFDAVSVLANQTGTYSYADVYNFISDTASFLKYGNNGIQNPMGTDHNCDATGRVSNRGGQGNLGGLGDLPCYAWFSQRIGPANWHLSSNDLAAFATEQWQLFHNLTLSAGLRVEAEQLPSPIAAVENSSIPATQKLPATAMNLAPRFGLAFAPARTTVLRLGAGLYYGRIDNSVLLAALTQTGSVNGDLDFFFKPTDVGAPPFPYVFPTEPDTAVVPGAVSFASNFRNQQIDQAVFSLEQQMPGHWQVSVSALASLGRRLPVSIDTNLNPSPSNTPQSITYAVVDSLQAGPLKAPTLTVPLYTSRLNPSYQQLASIESRANSTYQAETIKLTRNGGHGLSLHAHYLYAHATDWNPNESSNVASNDVLDPLNFRLEYGTSNLDIRHSAAATVLYQAPWKLQKWAGVLGNGWAIAAVGQYRSGLPFTMRTGGYLPGFYNQTGRLIQGVAPGVNGSGGDNRLYGIGRNTYRYPATWTADSRLAKRFPLPHERELEFLAESFNLFNHQNVTQIETTGYSIRRGTTAGDLPTLNFLTGLTSKGLPSTTPEFGKPLDINGTNYYCPREFQMGLRARF